MRAALLLALVALAAPGLAGPVGLDPEDGAYLDGGSWSSLVARGAWVGLPGDPYCAGRTFDLSLAVTSLLTDAYAWAVADAGPGCREAWGPLLLQGSWAEGWRGTCLYNMPPPCDILDVGKLSPGGEMPLKFRSESGRARDGALRAPATM